MTERLRAAGERLLAWYRSSARDLPWRRTSDPYAVWVSEIMLQQTTVSTVAPRWIEFLERFPDCAALAAASEDEVLSNLQGLGYYRRFRAMRRAAVEVVEKHGGVLPGDVRALRDLPGIGEYTAGAIASIAFGLREPAVDGNVIRVIARHERLAGPYENARAKRAIGETALAMMPEGAAGDFNQSLFDLGAGVCTPQSPRCLPCPISSSCAALEAGVVEDYPETAARGRDPVDVDVDVALLCERGKVLVLQRPADASRMPGFWELPEVWRRPGEDRSLVDHVAEVTGVTIDVGDVVATARHGITHHRLACRLLEASRRSGATPRRGARRHWMTIDELLSGSRPVSTITRKLLAAVRRASAT